MNRPDPTSEPPVGPALPGWSSARRPQRRSIGGRYCRLEPLDPQRHAALLHEANTKDTDGRLWTYLPYGPFENHDSYQDWADAYAKKTDPLFFAVVVLAKERPAGVIAYQRFKPEHGCIEISHLCFAPELQRTAAASEAVYLMLRYAFALGYRRIEWKCDTLNAPSRRAALRYGFTFEGIFRRHFVVKGRSRDTAWHAMIDVDWPVLERVYRQWFDDANFDSDGRQKHRLSDLTMRVLKRDDV